MITGSYTLSFATDANWAFAPTRSVILHLDKVKILRFNTDGTQMLQTGITRKIDYTVLERVWVRSDGTILRQWTPDEYLKNDPKRNIVIRDNIDGVFIDVDAHCIEFRKVFARNKYGVKLASYIKTVDYSKDTPDMDSNE